MDHLRYAGLSFETQREALFEIMRGEPLIHDALMTARALVLPQWRIVSGAIYNTVWNVLTGRPSGHGIKDIDLTYFDDKDVSWSAEDDVIKRGQAAFAHSALPVEIRNQARVHLWFKQRFGLDYAPLTNGDEAMDRFASKTHSVGIRLEPDDSLSLYAPFGLDDMFSFRLVPNTVLDNRVGHQTKGLRAKEVWPELTLVPWPDCPKS